MNKSQSNDGLWAGIVLLGLVVLGQQKTIQDQRKIIVQQKIENTQLRQIITRLKEELSKKISRL